MTFTPHHQQIFIELSIFAYILFLTVQNRNFKAAPPKNINPQFGLDYHIKYTFNLTNLKQNSVLNLFISLCNTYKSRRKQLLVVTARFEVYTNSKCHLCTRNLSGIQSSEPEPGAGRNLTGSATLGSIYSTCALHKILVCLNILSLYSSISYRMNDGFYILNK